MKKIIYTLLIALAGFGATSCDDFFDLKPSNEMVLDEFWTSESDVLSMVGSCYRSMQEPGFMERLLVWGELRSDNVILGTANNGNLIDIANLNLLPSNGFTYWGDFYNVINLCNTVEYYAPIAFERDPNFTRGQLNGYIAEVKGIRAYCYYTLVRAFRDIPFITEPVIDDTQTFQVAQSDPEEILRFLIEDLKAVEAQAVTSWSNESYTKGRVTQNCIRALIADMSLWLGEYQDCITYCNKIMTDANAPLSLAPSNVFNQSVFIDGNSTESIFELQFLRSNIPNYIVCEYFGTAGGRSGAAHEVFRAYDFSTTELFSLTDIRGYDFFFPSKSGVYPIKKFVSYRTDITTELVNEGKYTNLDAAAGNTNWMIYRLADVYLMKAEAMVELGTDLQGAFDLVCRTYDRANPEAGPGSLSNEAVGSQQAMRKLVFDERQREFLFEGKRYFDIIRLINRDRAQFSSIVNEYLVPKYTTLDQATVTSKLSEYDALFMPIRDAELKANLLLKQNPFYEVSSDIDINK